MNSEIKRYLEPGKKNIIIIYILFLCGIVAPLLPIIGAISAYINYRNNQNNKLSSHYIFLFRTCVISILVILMIIIANTVINFCVSHIFNTITFAFVLVALEYALFYLWYISRIAVGFKYLLDNSAHPNYMTCWVK